VTFPQEINNSDKIPRHPDRRETDSIPIVIDGTLVVPIAVRQTSAIAAIPRSNSVNNVIAALPGLVVTFRQQP